MGTSSDPYAHLWSAKWRAPFAVLGIRSSGTHIVAIAYLPLNSKEAAPSDRLSEQAVRELQKYCDDPQTKFTLPLMPTGTPYQQKVWNLLCSIPVGQTRTYKDIATLIRSAPRAIGNACAANPIALVIPCHRVVGANSLGGFMSAGDGHPLELKKWLLRHEGALMKGER